LISFSTADLQEMMSFWQELLPILVGQREPRRGEETDSECKRMCSVGGVSAERDWLIGCRFMGFEVRLLPLEWPKLEQT